MSNPTPKKTPSNIQSPLANLKVVLVRFHISVHFIGTVKGSIHAEKDKAEVTMTEQGVLIRFANSYKFVPFANISEVTLEA